LVVRNRKTCDSVLNNSLWYVRRD